MPSHTYDKQIVQLDGMITKLEEKAIAQGDMSPVPDEAAKSADQGASKEWDKFGTASDGWKKKQVYD